MKKLIALMLIVMISIVTPVAEATQNSFVEFAASMNTLQVEIDSNNPCTRTTNDSIFASTTNPAVADTTGDIAETLSANGLTNRNSINPAMAVSIGVESAVRRMTRAKKRAGVTSTDSIEKLFTTTTSHAEPREELSMKNLVATNHFANTNDATTMPSNEKEENIMSNHFANNNDSILEKICQVVNKSSKLLHYDFASGETTVENHACNMAFVYAVKHGYDPEVEFIYVTSEIDKKDAEKLLAWQQTCGTFMTFSGIDYIPLCLTASGGKECESIWCNKEHLREYSRAFRMELGKMGFKMEPNKLFTRMGLFFSSAKPLPFEVNTNKVDVVKDVIRNGANRSDGLALMMIDSEEEAKSVRNAFTMRPLKNVVIPVYRDKLIEIVGNLKIETIFKSKTNLANTKLIVGESGFKFSNMKETEKQFHEQLKDKGLFMAVNMNKHSKKWITYQPLHTLAFSDESINTLGKYNVEIIKALAKFENYIKLCPKAARRAIAAYPALGKTKYMEHEAQVGYRKFRTTARGGALANAGSFKVICPDFFDLMGVENLKAGECCCWALPEGWVIIIRYPHTSKESWVKLYNRHIDMGIIDPHVMVLNNYDDACARLGGADFDGDKVLVVENELYASLIMDTLDKEDIIHIVAPEGVADKKEFNAKTAEFLKRNFFAKLTKRNKIGNYANKLARAFACLYEAETDEEVENAKNNIIFWTKMVLVEVDKEKHGSTYLEAPENAYELGVLPNFIKYAKLAKHIGNNSKFEIDNDSYGERIACPLEKYSKIIAANTPAMKDFHPEIEGEFDFRNLMTDVNKVPSMPDKMFKQNTPKRVNGKIVKDNDGNTVYENGGYLDRIVFANNAQIKEWAEKMGLDTEMEPDELRSALLRETLNRLGASFNMSKSDVYDAVVAYIYGYLGDNASDAYARVFWNTYGDAATDILEFRFGKGEWEDLDSVDEAYDDEDADEEMPW